MNQHLSRGLVRAGIVVLLLVVAGFPLFAEDGVSWIGTNYTPGSIILSADAEVVLGDGFGVEILPGAEFVFTKFHILDTISLDLAGGLRVAAGLWRATPPADYGYTNFAIAPMLSMHMGLRGVSADPDSFLNRLDFVLGLGPAYSMYMSSGAWGADPEPSTGFGMASYAGVNYYITDSFAVTLGQSNVASFMGASHWSNGVGIGVVYHIGEPEVLGARPDLPNVSGNMMYAQFLSLYWASLSAGGFIYDDTTFLEGDGIRFRVTYTSEGDSQEIVFTRSLVKINSDGTLWWRIVYDVEDAEDSLEFEAITDSDHGLLRIRYIDPVTGSITEFEPDDVAAWYGGEDAQLVATDEFAVYQTGSERIRVPAGSYFTDKSEYHQDGLDYTWWTTGEVPGLVVKYEGTNETMDTIEGELLEVLTDQTSPWGAW